MVVDNDSHDESVEKIVAFGLGTAAAMVGPMPGHRVLTIDSFFLSLAVEFGFVGLVLFLMAMLGLMIRLVLRYSACYGSGEAHLGGFRTEFWLFVVVAAAISASMVAKIVLSLSHNLTMLFLYIAIAGVLLSNMRDAEVSVKPTERDVLPRVNENKVGSQ